MATLEERVAALVARGRSGDGGGRLSFRDLEALSDRAVEAVIAAIAAYRRLRPLLSDTEIARLVASLLARHTLAAWYYGLAYGREDARLATSGLTYLPAIRDGYDLPPDDFTQVAEERDVAADSAPRDFERLVTAVTTILAGAAADVEMRLERLAGSEPVWAAQRGYQTGGARAGMLGYRRRVNPDCCELCFWLWKGGYVYPINQPMHQHVGCRCYPEFTTDPVGQSKNPADRMVEKEFLRKYPSRKKKPRGQG